MTPQGHSQVRLGLASLLAPLSEREFFECYWGRRPVHVSRAGASLAPWLATLASEPLEALAKRAPRPISVTHRTGPRAAGADLAKSAWHGSAAEALRYYADHDAVTLYMVALDGEIPVLRSAVESLGTDLRVFHADGAAEASVFASKRGGGFDFHFDKNENFILQLQGAKRWRLAENEDVQRPTANYGEDPLEELALCGAQTLQPPRVWREVEMHPGDVLYMPRGHWHETEALSEHSLSLSLTFLSVTWADALLPYLRRLLIRDEAWRALAGPEHSEPQRAELQQRLADLPRVVGELQAELAPAAPSAFNQDHRYQRRRLASVRTEVDADGLRVRVLLPALARVQRSELQVGPLEASPVRWMLAQPEFTRDELHNQHPEIPETLCDALLDALESTGAICAYRGSAASEH